MDAIHMPGFTGETSLYRSRVHYHSTGSVVRAGGGIVQPQIYPIGTTCTRCTFDGEGCSQTCCYPLEFGGHCFAASCSGCVIPPPPPPPPHPRCTCTRCCGETCTTTAC
jgi:hypothetical protein